MSYVAGVLQKLARKRDLPWLHNKETKARMEAFAKECCVEHDGETEEARFRRIENWRKLMFETKEETGHRKMAAEMCTCGGTGKRYLDLGEGNPVIAFCICKRGQTYMKLSTMKADEKKDWKKRNAGWERE